MLFNLKKQMEDQQAEMNWLREMANLEKNVATHVHTWLVNQVDTLRKSQSSRTTEGRAQTPHHQAWQGIHTFHQQLEARPVSNLRRWWTLWGLRAFLSPKVPSHRRYHGSSPEATQPNETVIFKRNRVQKAETLQLTIVVENHHALFFVKICDAHLRSLFENLWPSSASLLVPRQDGGLCTRWPLFCRAFPSSLKGATYHWFYLLPKNSLWSFKVELTPSTTILLLGESFRRIVTIFS